MLSTVEDVDVLQLHLETNAAISAMFYYLRVCASVHWCLCECTNVLPVVQTWVLDVTDEPVSMQAFCVGAGCSSRAVAQWFTQTLPA